MAGKSSKGVVMYLSDGSDPTEMPITAVSNAAPAVITVTGVAADVPIGSVVKVNDTGFPELDGKYFPVSSAVDAAGSVQVTLTGSDTTASTAVLRAEATLDVWVGGAMTKLCLSSFAFNTETPAAVSVGTYCDPSASIPGSVTTAGTVTLAGYIDKDDAGYVEILEAVEDGKERVFSIILPQEQGEIIAPLTLSAVTWDIPLSDGGMAFTASGALGSSPVHRFDVAP